MPRPETPSQHSECDRYGGPVAMGAMMDRGLGVDLICYLFAGYCLLSGFLLYFALSQYRTHSEIELS